MNTVQLVGRLTRDPDIRYTNGGSSIARLNVAVDRRFKKEGGQQADFIGIIAFGKTAEFIEKYFNKGMRIGLTGRIQTGSYENNEGTKVYTTDVVAESVEFVEKKGGSQPAQEQQFTPDPVPEMGDGFMNIPEGIMDDGMPFN